MDPEIEDVMQDDVGEERADPCPLRRSPLRLVPLVALQDASPQPQLDEPKDAAIGDPVRHHPQQPLVVDRVEEAADVGVEHPGHALTHDRGVQRIESHVRAPPRPEAVGEAQEVDLVDAVEHRHHGLLDDLVLQGRDAQRPHPPVGLRDEGPPGRLGPVGAQVDPPMEVGESCLEVGLVLLPGQASTPGAAPRLRA